MLPESTVDLSGETSMDRIIETICHLHNQQTPHTQEFFDKLPQKENEFLVSVRQT